MLRADPLSTSTFAKIIPMVLTVMWRALTEKEAEDFLRKVNEYKVVEQLNKAPANISLLALRMSSETHRNAVLKVLNEAHVPNTISL